MRIWDASSGAELLNLPAPTRYAGDVEWSPDGKFIAISPDGFVKVIRAWQSTEELLNYAKQCCVFRELTSSERKQFGLQ
jgi:WD40 repeat protein